MVTYISAFESLFEKSNDIFANDATAVKPFGPALEQSGRQSFLPKGEAECKA